MQAATLAKVALTSNFQISSLVLIRQTLRTDGRSQVRLVPVDEAHWNLISRRQACSQGWLQLYARVRFQLELLHGLYVSTEKHTSAIY